ncbi:hypothetical protein D9758_000332 [Tetrapyrgos nigripes]|uniref:ditrans,polycis-polyprenyl diphosphate synthase [(2E,6E)-farnesyldiphosphate specific] n=1 Tax=Tetrapyrgos nigripes TaxID=182062 RepID=A0A8H5H149_9AGAR|nr:hypothetical protein D9758_000332 [Tetrapyrgos nigripes]
MGLLAYPFLLFLHIVYSLVVFSLSLWCRIRRHTPLPLNASRQRIPKHLAVLFVTDPEIDLITTEQRLMESVECAVKWSLEVGIEQLCLFDNEGILLRYSESIRDLVAPSPLPSKMQISEPAIVYPPTPPMSDYSESRSLSPEGFESSVPIARMSATSPRNELRPGGKHATFGKDDSKTLNINIVSREAGKPFVATMARSIAWSERRKQKVGAGCEDFHLSIAELEKHLEGPSGLSPPDFMIIHPIHPSKYNRFPLELHGFPPWQIRLTEIYCDRLRKQYRSRLMWFLPLEIRAAFLSSSLTEWEFREALDQYAGAEMRFGR